MATKEIRHAAAPLIGAAVLGIPLVYFCPTANPHVPRRKRTKLFFRALTVRRQQHLFFAHFLGDATRFSGVIEKRLASSAMDYLEKPHDINGLPMVSSRAELCERFNWPLDARIILIYAPLIEGSGYDNVAAAMPHVAAAHPEARLLWAGSGVKETHFLALLEQFHTASYVRLLPENNLNIPAADFPDLMLFPSALPNKSPGGMRYAATGVPIIATEEDALSELLRPAADRLLLDPDDIFDLREKVLYALDRLDALRAIMPQIPEAPVEMPRSVEPFFESMLQKIYASINVRGNGHEQ